MTFIMALETARCLEQGVLRSVPDANIGSIMGIGFPPCYGGADPVRQRLPGLVSRASSPVPGSWPLPTGSGSSRRRCWLDAATKSEPLR
jgi:hypothetical protein